jgi:hypothetical protein
VCRRILDSVGSAKFTRALQCGVPIVSMQWLTDSAAAGRPLPEADYNTDASDALLAATPAAPLALLQRASADGGAGGAGADPLLLPRTGGWQLEPLEDGGSSDASAADSGQSEDEIVMADFSPPPDFTKGARFGAQLLPLTAAAPPRRPQAPPHQPAQLPAGDGGGLTVELRPVTSQAALQLAAVAAGAPAADDGSSWDSPGCTHSPADCMARPQHPEAAATSAAAAFSFGMQPQVSASPAAVGGHGSSGSGSSGFWALRPAPRRSASRGLQHALQSELPQAPHQQDQEQQQQQLLSPQRPMVFGSALEEAATSSTEEPSDDFEVGRRAAAVPRSATRLRLLRAGAGGQAPMMATQCVPPKESAPFVRCNKQHPAPPAGLLPTYWHRSAAMQSCSCLCPWACAGAGS